MIFHASISATTVVSLEQVLQWAVTQADEVKSIDLKLEALQKEIAARDLELSPQLELNLSQTNDRLESYSSSTVDQTRNYNLLLTKPFSTGTEFSFSATDEKTRRPSFSPPTNYDLNWELELSQNLWQDQFGRGTRLRQQSDQLEYKLRRLELLTQKQKIIYFIETLYWDYTQAHKELVIHQKNLKRSEQIAEWVQKRMSRAAAEKSDVLQAQALLTNRRLQLRTLEDTLAATQLKLKQNFPQAMQISWAPDENGLTQSRKLVDLVLGEKVERVESLAAMAARYESELKKAKANQIEDSLRPQLRLFASYGKNAIDADRSTAQDALIDEDNYVSEVGTQFVLELDWGLQQQRKKAAKLEADAAEILSQKTKQDSLLAWNDLTREVNALAERLKISEELALIQSKKSLEERRRYEQGRSTAFQALTFEVDAGEAEIRVTQLQAQLRKAEAKARLFSGETGQP